MTARTSRTHPIQIASLTTPVAGIIGLTFCPGKRDPTAMTGAWQRDLATDLQAIADWGARALVTLMEAHELDLLEVPELGRAARSIGLDWYHLPIRDVSVPGPSFEAAWDSAGGALRRMLRGGERIVVHCRGGLGRTGVVAARLLIELGETPERALAKVRTARPGAVETREQERYVLQTQ